MAKKLLAQARADMTAGLPGSVACDECLVRTLVAATILVCAEAMERKASGAEMMGIAGAVVSARKPLEDSAVTLTIAAVRKATDEGDIALVLQILGGRAPSSHPSEI